MRKGARFEGSEWRVDEIHLSLVTTAKGIAGNGLPPRAGWNFRVSKGGQHQGYVQSNEALMNLMGEDYYTLREVA